MLTTHAVGIDLGTTYSCIAYLNEHGEPVTLVNQEGELATPSVVLFDDDHVVVGTEALRNAIVRPHEVVQNSKRFMGDNSKYWKIGHKRFTPIDISAYILKKLISAAQEQIGTIEEAVITVPAQFSDAQRHATLQAGHRAGLQQVDIINEPVAAALCYVLSSEGLWFTELADEQRIMVYDLGGGTFDLSLVRYHKDEVSVIASSGDLELGGIDWTRVLYNAIADQFSNEFGSDPRDDPQSLQALALEAEQTKRSLSARPRAALTCQHAGHRKTYQIGQEQFERLARPLVERTRAITRRMLRSNKIGWAHVDVVLTTGGSSRMPMIRTNLKQLSGSTLNTALSPDQSIAHGATYYAGMLLTNKKFARSILNEMASSRLKKVRQQSVNARALGILVRDPGTKSRVPHYLIPANSPLPTEETQTFGTVIPNQKRVHLKIVESDTDEDRPPVKLGDCIIEGLPKNLPIESQIAVTISYDAQARVHVAATDVTSGKQAATEILRHENLVPQLEHQDDEDLKKIKATRDSVVTDQTLPVESEEQVPLNESESDANLTPAAPEENAPFPSDDDENRLYSSVQPVPLCNECGEPLDVRGRCLACGSAPPAHPGKKRAAGTRSATKRRTRRKAAAGSGTDGRNRSVTKKTRKKKTETRSTDGQSKSRSKKKRSASATEKRQMQDGNSQSSSPNTSATSNEDQFWELVE